MTVTELLDYASVAYEPRERDNVYIECPYCGSSNLSINVFTGQWHCWSAVCEKKGNFQMLAKELELSSEAFSPSEAPVRDKSLSDEERAEIEMSLTNKAEIIEFCAKRKLDSEYVLKQGLIGYGPSFRGYTFPFRDSSGRIIGCKVRSEGAQYIKGEEPDLYVIDQSDLKKDKLVVVEGEIDAITLKQFGIPAVATLGAGKTKGFPLLNRVRQVLAGYDMDEAGNAGVEKLASEIGRYRVRRVNWTAKDPNDMLAGLETDKQRLSIITCLREAKALQIDSKSKTVAETMKEYMEMMTKAPRKRYSWGFPRLDSFTEGIGGGMFIGVLAEAGTGKTTFVINAACNIANSGTAVGVCSLEEHPINEVTPKIAATILGHNPKGGCFTDEEVNTLSEVTSRIHLYDDDESVDSVIEWMKEVYYANDVKVVFVDYLQLMVKDEKDVQQIKEICYKFKKLTKELPELCIVMIIQPKQKQKLMTKDGAVSNENLDGSDARGGAAINQSVDAMLTIRSVAGNPDRTEFRYTKVRGHLRVSKRQWVGQSTQLDYDHATMRQKEIGVY